MVTISETQPKDGESRPFCIGAWMRNKPTTDGPNPVIQSQPTNHLTDQSTQSNLLAFPGVVVPSAAAPAEDPNLEETAILFRPRLVLIPE